MICNSTSTPSKSFNLHKDFSKPAYNSNYMALNTGTLFLKKMI